CARFCSRFQRLLGLSSPAEFLIAWQLESVMMRKLLGGWILGSLSIAGAVAACNASSTSSATTSGSGGASSGGPSNGSGQATSSGVDFDACFACGDQACASEANACNSACRGLLDCVFGCEAGDSNCQLDCVPENGQPEAQAAV